MRSRSPIETMIDQACGFDRASYVPPPQVTLRCRQCERTKKVAKDETDPDGTTIVDCLCDKCDNGGNKPEVLYFDEAGRQFDGERFV